ncbi:MAG: hypothetical protein SF028_06445 [Candidatus Sumerlaeia bacterium]|nr:hypothetical protein [Candidatus Sumerlaeia bacterium]
MESTHPRPGRTQPGTLIPHAVRYVDGIRDDAGLVELAMRTGDPHTVAFAVIAAHRNEINAWLDACADAIRAAVSSATDTALAALGLRGRRRMAEDALGMELPLRDDELDAMMAEVERYKWLEAERAGRDIWRERDAENPLRPALVEWFRRHFGSWYLTQRRIGRTFWSGGVL